MGFIVGTDNRMRMVLKKSSAFSILEFQVGQSI